MTFLFQAATLKRFPTETEAKLREIVAALLKAAPDREGGSGRKLKNTVGPTFPTMVQEPENTFDDINS